MLTSVIALLPLALALPLESREANEFDIVSLGATLPYKSGPYGSGDVDSFLTISVTYPDVSSTSEATLTTQCTHDWPKGTDPNAFEWAPCDDPALQWRLPADGWVYQTNYVVELFLPKGDNGSGLDASHQLRQDPNHVLPNAYLSCIQMGKFQPLRCDLGGPLAALQGPVVMPGDEVSSRPN
ncbi:hypothetical protein MGN70_004092 [Eutypa lata]|nr:hypothetical protein MGN70_004092 [Eutypa lata]